MIITWRSNWKHKHPFTARACEITVMPISGIFMYECEAYGFAEIYGNSHLPLSRQDLEKAGSWPPINKLRWGGNPHQWMTIEMVSENDGINMNGGTYFTVKVSRILPDIYLFRRFIRMYVRDFRKRRENRMLAVGMMTHARLGKGCAFQKLDPELVRMVVRCVDTA